MRLVHRAHLMRCFAFFQLVRAAHPTGKGRYVSLVNQILGLFYVRASRREIATPLSRLAMTGIFESWLVMRGIHRAGPGMSTFLLSKLALFGLHVTVLSLALFSTCYTVLYCFE